MSTKAVPSKTPIKTYSFPFSLSVHPQLSLTIEVLSSSSDKFPTKSNPLQGYLPAYPFIQIFKDEFSFTSKANSGSKSPKF